MNDDTRERLIDVTKVAIEDTGRDFVDRDSAEYVFEAVLDALHPEVTTVEKLDALPTNSVVIDAGRWIHERWERAVPDDHGWVRVGWAFNEPADPPALPARILYRPDKETQR